MPRFSKQLFVAAFLAAATGVTGSVRADEPQQTPQSDAAVQATVETVNNVFAQPASFTSRMAESGACGAGACGAAGCQGDTGASWLQGALDKPLLSDFRDMQIGDCLTASVGGELRHRYMDESNRLRPGGPGDSTYDLWRITPFMELKYGDAITGYVQAIDASIFDEDLPVTGIDENRSDLLQYYLDAQLAEVGEGKLRGRIGRQFLKYGSQHLVSPLGWSNTFRNFEGVKLYYSSENWDIDGFWTRPVNAAAGNIFRPTSSDSPDASRTFSGVYSTYKGLQNATLDLYWLYLDENEDKGNRIDGQRHTFGGRYNRTDVMKDACGNVVGTLALEVEGAFQVGDSETFLGAGDEDIEAGMFHTALGYTFNQAPWTPTVKGVFYWASGDDNPGDGENNNFNTLFPLGHAYWGIIDNLNGSNLLDYSLQASVKPMDKLTVLAALHWFEKDESATPIFNVAGAPFPGGATSTSSNDIGTELDLIATYAVSKQLTVQAGYSWFWYGDAVSTAAAPLPRDDAEQFYIMTTLGF